MTRIMRHAWYSKKMTKARGYNFGVVYAREDGELVVCTVVSKKSEQPCTWDDTEYRGEVVRFVRAATQYETDNGAVA